MKLSARGVLLAVLVVAASATCVRLGFWQLARMRYKHAIHAVQRALLAEPPVEVEHALPATPPEAGRRVRLRGHWDPTAEILLSGRTHEGAPGVSWVRGVRLESGECVLVELGWLPSDDGRTQATPTKPDAGGPNDFIGVALPLERSARPTSWAELQSQWPRTRLWSARVLERDSVAARFAPPVAGWYVRALQDPRSRDVYPGPLAEPYIIPDESMHLSYAIQWFGFAAIIGLGSRARALRRPPVTPLRQAAAAACRSPCGRGPPGPEARGDPRPAGPARPRPPPAGVTRRPPAVVRRKPRDQPRERP